ncbi:hypothetical protein J437_LFUL019382, partial [Ladona fulva]
MESVEDSSGNISLEKGTSDIPTRISKIKDTSEKIYEKSGKKGKKSSTDFSEVTSSVHLERVEDFSGNVSLEKGTSEILKRISENKDTSEKIYEKSGIRGKKSLSIIKSKRKETDEESEISESEAPAQNNKAPQNKGTQYQHVNMSSKEKKIR